MRWRRQRSTRARNRQSKIENQTLSSPATFSSQLRRPQLESDLGRPSTARGHKGAVTKSAASWRQRIGFFVLLVVCIVSLASILRLNNNPKVLLSDSGTSDGLFRESDVYQQAAQKILSRSIWSKTKLSIDSAGLSAQMRRQFPELSRVSLALPLVSHRPLIYLETSRPTLILANSSQSFVVDTRGIAILPTAELVRPASLNLPRVTDQSGLNLRLGHQVLTTDDVEFIRVVAAQFASRHFAIASMTLPQASSELDVQLVGQQYFVKFNLQTNTARQQSGTALATIALLQRQSINPNKYIDVRIDGRAYYQ